MIKSVITSGTGMVAVFDENEEQIPEYQGEYDEVRENILRDAPPNAVFSRVRTVIEVVSREEW